MVALTKYTIDVSYRFDRRSIGQIDKAMRDLEKKIKGFSNKLKTKMTFSIEKFDVDQKKLNFALGNALDRASNSVVFHVNRFNIDQSRLNGLMMNAMANATRAASMTSTLRPRVAQGQGNAVQGRNAVNRAGNIRGGHVALGGGVAGIAARIPMASPLLALAGGGYGLSQLNQRNQQVVAAQLQTQATVQQFGGTMQQGQASFDWLRNQANRIGFNYLDTTTDYNKLLSGLMGAGYSLEQGQGVFKGFAELARVNKLDRTTQNRLFRALSQVAGKGKLQAEELTQQIAEALPGGVSLFAEAYQRQIGGDKTGQEAVAQLMEDMKKGKVRSGVLTFAADLASQRAQPGLEAASRASQAEQARYQNTINDLAVVASNAGVEEGFARIFRTLNSALKESNDLVKTLASGFNEATKWADDLLLFQQSFVRALEGKDSLVADWLGADATMQLREDWKSISESMEKMSNVGTPTWMPTLQEISKDIADQLRIISSLISGDFSGFGTALKNFVVSRYEQLGNALATGPNFALRTAGELFNTSVPQFGTNNPGFYAPSDVRGRFGLGQSPVTGTKLQENYDMMSKMPVGPQDSNAFGQKSAKLDFSMSVLVDGLESGSLSESYKKAIEDTTKNWFSMQLSQTDLNFSQTE